MDNGWPSAHDLGLPPGIIAGPRFQEPVQGGGDHVQATPFLQEGFLSSIGAHDHHQIDRPSVPLLVFPIRAELLKDGRLRLGREFHLYKPQIHPAVVPDPGGHGVRRQLRYVGHIHYVAPPVERFVSFARQPPDDIGDRLVMALPRPPVGAVRLEVHVEGSVNALVRDPVHPRRGQHARSGQIIGPAPFYNHTTPNQRFERPR